ncbi:MAG: cation:proton antiporter [Lachnospiraceae bacterium]
MLISITYILLSGLILGWVCKKIKFPSLFGMILAGILIGPHVLNLIDESILNISAQIRKIALIIILLRAGLKLSLDDLKKVGRPAVLMCFLPATLELLGMILLAPKLLGISLLDAAILGAVVGAVSPAVIVPKMIKLMDEGYGTTKGIPQMILAGASVDDVFVIVLFTTFTGLAQGETVDVMSFVNIPVSIVIGVLAGLAIGYGLFLFFEKVRVRDVVKVLILLSFSFIMVTIEDKFSGIIPFASLIGIMSLGIMIKAKKQSLAVELSQKYDTLWVGAEIFLFVLVGASVAVDSALSAGPSAILLLFGVLVFRMFGVFLCLIGTNFTKKEKAFCMLAYTPKATVQAAIGGIPLAIGLSCGNTVLTVSVIAILLTAPLGAFAIDITYRRWLS